MWRGGEQFRPSKMFGQFHIGVFALGVYALLISRLLARKYDYAHRITVEASRLIKYASGRSAGIRIRWWYAKYQDD